MGTFLFLLLLFLVIIPAIRMGAAVWRTRSQFKKVFNAMNGGGSDQRSAGRQQQHQSQSKKKIDPSMGEYVKFEDIPDSAEEQPHKDTTNHSAHRTEQQIVDVEWEDI
jgi:hypothetical protein